MKQRLVLCRKSNVGERHFSHSSFKPKSFVRYRPVKQLPESPKAIQCNFVQESLLAGEMTPRRAIAHTQLTTQIPERKTLYSVFLKRLFTRFQQR